MVLLQLFPLKVFTQRNFIANFIRLNFIILFTKTTNLLFEPPYAFHLWLVGKPVVNFLFAIIEYFSKALALQTL